MATQEEINKKWELAQRTSLWKRTLGSADKYVKPLRESFIDARENAIILLDKIRDDFKNLTVHDITHVDSLWNVADTIIGEDYPINPLEGYILGIAFLIHDAALSYDAIGGTEVLRNTIVWKDAHADNPGDMDEEEFEKECDFEAIRALHAQYAEDILNKKFERDNTTTFYIIDNDEYRIQFGDMIGKIAASHHWSIDEVESKLENQITPVAGFPSEWEINEQKLACILRCADAGHIDNGRAPYGIYNSLKVNGVSRDHWESQTRLGQVRENRKSPEQLLITSIRPFGKDNFAAWNVAYDAVRIFDEELKKSNELLKPAGLSFPHIGVTGAESKEALSECIKTQGWLPCSFGVHTSNVKALIENLGGSKLYGEDNLLLVALRELIQNSRDAIQARRFMDGYPEYGRITIRTKEVKGRCWIEVEDNGIGMSMDCIKYHLLDFGSSYWKSRLSKDELPGLRSKRFKSIGKFGIGFYSVFMVAKSVVVITRRKQDGEEAKKIEFPEGLTLSPILSNEKQSVDVSTLVRFELKKDVDGGLLNDYKEIKQKSGYLPKVLSRVVAGLDVDVYYEKKGVSKRIHPNVKSHDFNKEEWLRGLFIDCPGNISELASRMESLIDENGDLRGWVLSPECFYSSDYIVRETPCIQTISGLASSLDIKDININNYLKACFLGYLDGKEANISRNRMIIDKPLKICLQKWAKQKYRENYDKISNSSLLAYDYCRIMSLCELKNEVLQENLIEFYSRFRSKIKVGSIIGFIRIQRYLYSGVIEIKNGVFSDRYRGLIEAFLGFRTSKKNKELILKKLEKYDREEVLFDLQELEQINRLSETSFLSIINKFCRLVRIFPYDDENRFALGVWVNLMLDKLLHFMIDWGKVDDEELQQLLSRKKGFGKACKYLEQFKTPTFLYLSEIGVPLNENS